VNDEAPQKILVDRAWSLYLAIHTDVNPADVRRCTLERYLQQRWDFGEKDLEDDVRRLDLFVATSVR
jgi:hypothetical protein